LSTPYYRIPFHTISNVTEMRLNPAQYETLCLRDKHVHEYLLFKWPDMATGRFSKAVPCQPIMLQVESIIK